MYANRRKQIASCHHWSSSRSPSHCFSPSLSESAMISVNIDQIPIHNMVAWKMSMVAVVCWDPLCAVAASELFISMRLQMQYNALQPATRWKSYRLASDGLNTSKSGRTSASTFRPDARLTIVIITLLPSRRTGARMKQVLMVKCFDVLCHMRLGGELLMCHCNWFRSALSRSLIFSAVTRQCSVLYMAMMLVRLSTFV